MLTNGLVGVRFNKELHLCYQSHDCGPEGLGTEVVSFVRGTSEGFFTNEDL